jgi:uncharacterized protein
MNFQEKVIENTHKFVKKTLENAEAGHDYWHIKRVLKNAEKIAQTEGGDLFVIQLGSLLHDIADSKFHDGDENIGPKIAQDFLINQKVEPSIIDHVVKIIKHISFKNSFDKIHFRSKELDIIQDADRLDAMGAIGIARAFIYGGHKNNLIYHPEIKPKTQQNKEDYKKGNSTTINHFYEKLLKLKDMMNTKTGYEMALDRHQFMEQFLKQFYKEWDL